MQSSNTIITFLNEPLHPTTRKTRTYSLFSSSIGILVSYAGVMPTKITTFGIQLSLGNKQALLYFLSAVIGYFIIAYVLYFLSNIGASMTSMDLEKSSDPKIEFTDLSKKMLLVHSLRFFFEIYVPLILAIISCGSVFLFAQQLSQP